MSDMTHADFASFHKAQAKIFHHRAQVARKEALICKDKRDFLGKLKADGQAKEYRRARDTHKAKAKQHKEAAA